MDVDRIKGKDKGKGKNNPKGEKGKFGGKSGKGYGYYPQSGKGGWSNKGGWNSFSGWSNSKGKDKGYHNKTGKARKERARPRIPTRAESVENLKVKGGTFTIRVREDAVV